MYEFFFCERKFQNGECIAVSKMGVCCINVIVRVECYVVFNVSYFILELCASYVVFDYLIIQVERGRKRVVTQWPNE